jgi:hypothetical protein
MPKSIDHINHIKYDNRIENLRDVDHKTNLRNKSIHSNNTSGQCGINYKDNKWVVSIRVNYKSIHIGVYSDLHDAVDARKSAEKKYNFHENHGTN